MTSLGIRSLTFIAICNNIVSTQKPFVIEQNGPITTATSSKVGEKGDKSAVIKESYTAGICKEGEDDVILYKTSYKECLKECRSRNKCTSVNMYSKTSVCRLNFQDNLYTRPCPKYIYSEKANWKLKSVGGCEQIHCDKNQRCSVQSGGAVCVPAECPQIKRLPNGVIFGNLVEIGKKRGFRCDQGYSLIGSRAITCQSDGRWSADPPTCLPAESSHSQEPSPSTSVRRNTTVVSKTSEQTTASQLINDVTTTSVQSNTTDINQTSVLTTALTLMKDTDSVNTIAHGQETTTATTTDQDDISKTGDYDSHCEDESDCDDYRQECRQNRCKCIFGTMYNLEFRECGKDCDVLGDTFQKFTNTSALVHGVPLATGSVKREADCTDMCLSKKNCTLVRVITILNRKEDILRCFVYNITIRQLYPVVDLANTIYIRDCGETLTPPATQSISGTTPTSVKQEQTSTLVSASSSAPPASLESRNLNKQSTTASTSSTTANDAKTYNDEEKESPSSQTRSSYQSNSMCPPGTVFHYFFNSCRSDCLQNAATFQLYKMAKLDTKTKTIDISTEDFQGSVEDCLGECTNMTSCIVVVYIDEAEGCTLIKGEVIPPSGLFMRAGSDMYVRECL